MKNTKQRVSSFKGKKHHLESRKKMSISRIGNTNCVGRVLSEETKRKISETSKKRIGKKGVESGNWKGNAITVSMMHRRIENILGKPLKCEHCKSTSKKCYDWSHKTHRYTLNIDEWMRLCRSCHKKYDNKLKKYDN